MVSSFKVYDLLAGNTQVPTIVVPPRESDPRAERFTAFLCLPSAVAPLGPSGIFSQREEIPFSRTLMSQVSQRASPYATATSTQLTKRNILDVPNTHSLKRDANRFDNPIILSESQE
jgi:hypothetical protein